MGGRVGRGCHPTRATPVVTVTEVTAARSEAEVEAVATVCGRSAEVASESKPGAAAGVAKPRTTITTAPATETDTRIRIVPALDLETVID